MDITVYWLSGNVSNYKTTYLPYESGYLVENDNLHSSLEEVLSNGLILERCAYLYNDDNSNFDPIEPRVIQDKIVIVSVDQVPDISSIVVDGITTIARSLEGELKGQHLIFT